MTVAPPSGTRFRALLRFGLPLVAGMGGHALFNVVDLAMVGAYEKDPGRAELTISAVTIGALLSTAPLVFFNGVSNGSVPVIAQHFGAGNWRRANQACRQALLLAVLFAVVLGVIPALFADEICLAFEAAPGDELTVAAGYFAVMSVHSWATFLLMQLTANMRAIGMSFWPMTLLLASNAANVLLNWLLIFGHWGLPELGAVGSAWATVIVRAVATFAAVAVLWRADRAIRLTPFGWRPRMRFMWSVVRNGIPVALQWSVRMAAIALVLLVLADAGPAVRAGYGIGTRLDSLALFGGLGWGAACAALVGQHLAKGGLENARRVANQVAVLNVVTMSVAGLCFFLFPDVLVRLFSLRIEGNEQMQAVTEGVTYLRIAVFSYPALALCVVWAHTLNGAGSVKTPLLIDTIGLLGVQIPLVWWLHDRFGVEAAWWALVASHTLVALVYYLVFRGGAWERKRLI